MPIPNYFNDPILRLISLKKLFLDTASFFRSGTLSSKPPSTAASSHEQEPRNASFHNHFFDAVPIEALPCFDLAFFHLASGICPSDLPGSSDDGLPNTPVGGRQRFVSKDQPSSSLSACPLQDGRTADEDVVQQLFCNLGATEEALAPDPGTEKECRAKGQTTWNGTGLLWLLILGKMRRRSLTMLQE
ncbi:hypothetical protein QBC44DRAFT_310841 [Cladorrhinum sp. PSN332]|nr:hypothetical protein QBC44DRAFT_310841 [Cladorrhinum sp. PSN332]